MDIGLLLGLAPVAYLLQILIHEGSHAVVALAQGLGIQSFAFWPHKVENTLYFGRVVYDRPLDFQDTRLKRGLRAGAPFLFSVPLLGLNLALLDATRHEWFLVWTIALGVDLSRNWLQPGITGAAYHDWSKVGRALWGSSGLTRFAGVGLGAFCALVVAFECIRAAWPGLLPDVP